MEQMRREIYAVIFDQDGLMFDTERLSLKCWRMVEADFGIHISEAFLATIRGMTWADALKRFKEEFGEGIDIEALRSEKMAYFMQMLRSEGVPVKKGLRELLAWLAKNGYKRVLATASSMDYTVTNLKDAGIEGYFENIISGDIVAHAKPDPEIFYKAAELIGERPEHCLVLEDSLNGVKAGLDGGFHVIMIPDLTQPTEEIRSRVDCICSSLLDVIEWLSADFHK